MPQPARKKPTDVYFEASASEGVTVLAAETANALPKFSMTAYTGGKMRVAGYYYPVVVNLATAKAAATVAYLRDHNVGRIVGHSDGASVVISPQRIKAAGEISGAGPDAAEVIATSKNKFPWQASIGGMPTDVKFIDRGEKETVNGRVVEGPCYLLEGVTIREISFVALGADGNTSANVAASFCLEVSAMNFTEWLAAKKIDEATLTAEVKAVLQASYDAEMKTGEDDKHPKPDGGDGKVKASATGGDNADPINVLNARMADNFERVAMVQEVASKYPKIAAEAIKGMWSRKQVEDAVELEDLRASRAKPPKPPTGGRDATDAPILEAALLIAGGVPESAVGKQFSQDVMNKAVSREYRSVSLHAMMNLTIVAATGHGFHGLSYKSNDFVRAAQEADRTLRSQVAASGVGFSTLSMSNVLENVAHKAMIARYNAQEVVWPSICGIRTHNDFKIHSRYQINGAGSFKKVGPDGELKHVGLTDAKYTNQLETYGALISLTRQMQINDDLGAFLQIPNIIGEQAQIRREEGVFVLLLSLIGTTFSTANKNRLTGAGSALGVAAVTAARQKFKNRVDSNGKPILISPSILLTGSGGNLADLADDFYTQSEFAVTTTADTPKSQKNPHKGKYRPIQAPYISNTDITDQDGNAISGQTSTGWALLADPNVRTLIAMANLNGNTTPTIERQESAFDTLGMIWRGYDDFGVGVEDPNGGVWSDGV